MKEKRTSLLIFLIIIALFIPVFFYIISYNTPLWWDDYQYSCIVDRVREVVIRPVYSFNDVIQAANEYYMHGLEGRYLINGLILHTLINLCPSFIICLVNTLMWCTLIIFIGRIIRREETPRTWLSSFILVGMAFFMILTAKHHILFWKTGSVNYLWPGVVYTAFFIYYTQLHKKNKLFGAFICLFAGAFHDDFAVPFILFMGIDFLAKPSKEKFLYCTMFSLGLLTLLLAPSTIHRIMSTTHGAAERGFFFDLIRGFIKNFIASPLTAICFIWIIIKYIKDRANCLSFLKENKYIIYFIWCCIMIYSFLGYNGFNMYFPLEIFSFILFAKLLLTCTFKHSVQYIAMITLISIFICFNIQFTIKSIHNMHGTQEEINMIKDTPDGIIRADFIPVGIRRDYIFNRSYQVRNGGKHKLVCIPSDIYYGVYVNDTFCTPRNEIAPNIYYSPKSYFAVYPMKSMADTLSRFSIHYIHKNIPICNPIFKYTHKPKTVQVDPSKSTCIIRSHNGKYYRIIDARILNYFMIVDKITTTTQTK